MFEPDYILRLIQQISAIVTRHATRGRAGQVEMGADEIASAWDALGVPPELLDRLDGAGLAAMFAPGERRDLVATLLRLDADQRDRDAPGAGAARRALADALLKQA